MKATVNRRILLIDDNPAIHDDYRKILGVSSKSTDTSLMVMESALFGAPSPRESAAEAGGFPALFDLTSALQGVEAVKRVKEALEAKNPFAVAFVDMRMPPGWDGLETILRMWEVDPSVQVVICTAYSDRSWSEIRQSLGNSDQLLILKKPFDSIEVLQCACTLTEKWTLTQLAQLRMEGLEGIIKERTAEALKAMRLKNDFLSNLSHELLTPMNGIVGLADSLESTRLNADQQELVGLLKNCSFQLMNLLKDILDFNELEANRLKLQSASFKPRNVLTEVEALLAVDVRSRFVEDQQFRIMGHRPRQGQKLPFARTERTAALAQVVRQATGQPRQQSVGMHGGGGCGQALGRCISEQAEVVGDRAGKQVHLLGHGGDAAAQPGAVAGAQVEALAGGDRAALWIMQAEQQRGDGGLA